MHEVAAVYVDGAPGAWNASGTVAVFDTTTGAFRTVPFSLGDAQFDDAVPRAVALWRSATVTHVGVCGSSGLWTGEAGANTSVLSFPGTCLGIDGVWDGLPTTGYDRVGLYSAYACDSVASHASSWVTGVVHNATTGSQAVVASTTEGTLHAGLPHTGVLLHATWLAGGSLPDGTLTMVIGESRTLPSPSRVGGVFTLFVRAGTGGVGSGVLVGATNGTELRFERVHEDLGTITAIHRPFGSPVAFVQSATELRGIDLSEGLCFEDTPPAPYPTVFGGTQVDRDGAVYTGCSVGLRGLHAGRFGAIRRSGVFRVQLNASVVAEPVVQVTTDDGTT